jgi:hypothetical protein
LPLLGDVNGMHCAGELFGKDDPQRFFWFGKVAAVGFSSVFLNEMSDQVRSFVSGTDTQKLFF